MSGRHTGPRQRRRPRPDEQVPLDKPLVALHALVGAGLAVAVTYAVAHGRWLHLAQLGVAVVVLVGMVVRAVSLSRPARHEPQR